MNNRKELCPQGEKLLECRTYEEAIALYRQILATIADQDAQAALNWYLREANNRIDAADVRNMKVGKNCGKYKLDLKGPDPDDMIERQQDAASHAMITMATNTRQSQKCASITAYWTTASDPEWQPGGVLKKP